MDQHQIAELIARQIPPHLKSATDMLNYVDQHLDQWNIDIANHFLDDIIELSRAMIYKQNAKKKPEKRKKKVSGEEMEDLMLRRAQKEFDDIMKRTQREVAEVAEDFEWHFHGIEKEHSEKMEEMEWNVIVERVDMIYGKMDLTNGKLAKSGGSKFTKNSGC